MKELLIDYWALSLGSSCWILRSLICEAYYSKLELDVENGIVTPYTNLKLLRKAYLFVAVISLDSRSNART
jgi:hypothetical protein